MTSDITEVDKGSGSTRKKKEFAPSDWKLIAEYVESVLSDRKRRRKDREKVWNQVDRQIAMKPDNSHKMRFTKEALPTAVIDPQKAWLPEIELPWQATALEILSSRSEEHTSELQSLMRISYAVFCLQKKKKELA